MEKNDMSKLREFRLQDTGLRVIVDRHGNAIAFEREDGATGFWEAHTGVTEPYARIRARLLGREREAATEGQVHAAWCSAPGVRSYRDFTAGVRWAEAHHGICKP
jgi:hypothetical protein